MDSRIRGFPALLAELSVLWVHRERLQSTCYIQLFCATIYIAFVWFLHSFVGSSVCLRVFMPLDLFVIVLSAPGEYIVFENLIHFCHMARVDNVLAALTFSGRNDIMSNTIYSFNSLVHKSD